MTNVDTGRQGERPIGASRRAATIYDIARGAGVSHQSVSRFMRGFEQRAQTRESNAR